MDSGVLRYRSSLAYNREVFLIEHGAIVKAFSLIDENFMELLEIPQTKRDIKGKSYVSLVPFLLLFQRQSPAAFEALAVYQAYEAWVLLRPGVEPLLIIGKFLDDPKLVGIWRTGSKIRRPIVRPSRAKDCARSDCLRRIGFRASYRELTTISSMLTLSTSFGISEWMQASLGVRGSVGLL